MNTLAMTLNDFVAKLEEYKNNDTQAFLGKVKITSNEREDLRIMFQKLPSTDRAPALEQAKARGVDTAGW